MPQQQQPVLTFFPQPLGDSSVDVGMWMNSWMSADIRLNADFSEMLHIVIMRQDPFNKYSLFGGRGGGGSYHLW